VVVDNTEHDGRFDACASPGLVPACSAIGAPVFGADGIAGVLLAESSTPDTFGHDDAHFIQAMANIVGTALIGTPT
jgi:GAF domain-containing protein